MRKIEVWGTVEFSKTIDVPDEYERYEDVYDYCTDHLDITEDDLDEVAEINVVYKEE